MRSLTTELLVYRFLSLPMMLEGGGQKKVMPIHETFLRYAEVMGQKVVRAVMRVVIPRRREMQAVE